MNFTVMTPWGPIQVHWCPQETMMFILMLTSLGGMWAWVRSKFKKHEKTETLKHHECCHPNDKHEEGK